MEDIPTFPVMILIGLTVFGLAAIAQAGFDFGFEQGGEQAQKKVIMSESFGEVGSANQDFRNIKFGGFNVGETRGDVEAYTSRKEKVSSGLIGGETISIDYNATQPRQGNINFEVLGKTGSGPLYVKVNGEKIFEEHLVTTGTPNITVPSRNLKPGMNKIVIGSSSGLVGSSSYTIEDLRVTVDDRKFHDFSDHFQVYKYELEDFVEASLDFTVRTGSVKTEPLKVKVNGNTVFSKRQVRSENTVELERGEADLHPGYNTIRFETDGESAYHIEDAGINIRYIGTTSTETLNRNFQVYGQELSYINREDTVEKAVFDYQRKLPSPRLMKISLNGHKYNLTPENGRNTLELPSEHFEEENSLIIKSNSSYSMNNFRILSEKVEE